jgi:general nucleoside transport system permease protein
MNDELRKDEEVNEGKEVEEKAAQQYESKEGKKNALAIFFEEMMKGSPGRGSWWRRTLQATAIPILAIFSGLVIGAVIIILTSEEVYAAFAQSPVSAIQAAWHAVSTAYQALFIGSFGDPARIMAAIQGDNELELRRAINPIFDSLVSSTPYIFAGLAVALGFRAGLFNIGVEGQLFVGAICAAYVGYAITGLPAVIHLPLALIAGALGGAAWGFIPGWLKAKTGGHEVINTIMLNYIAFRLSDWLLTGPMKRPGSFNPVSPTIEPTAVLPRFFESPIRFHLGFFVALGVAALVYWFLFKTKWGFFLRTVGANPHAARYSGMNIMLGIVAAMSLSGALAGLAGANEVLGVNYNLAMAFSSGYGFDAIALALLGKSHPVGVVLAALLFGTLRSGALRMQLTAGIPIDIISVLQALILAFIAAPAIIRTIYRLRQPKEGDESLVVASWGGS